MSKYRLLDKQGNVKIVYTLAEALALIRSGYRLLSSGIKANKS